MSADSTTAYKFQVGAWTDWSRGAVYGATLTLYRRDGDLLIAFVAFFVAYVGTRFWRLLCVILHYIYSSGDARDGVHHQRQVLLRNAPNAEAALWTLTDIGLAWRKIAERVWVRLLPIVGLAVACIVGFTLAGVFSSASLPLFLTAKSCCREKIAESYRVIVASLVFPTPKVLSSLRHWRQQRAMLANAIPYHLRLQLAVVHISRRN